MELPVCTADTVQTMQQSSILITFIIKCIHNAKRFQRMCFHQTSVDFIPNELRDLTRY